MSKKSKYTNKQIDEAIAKVRAAHPELCPTFDEQVKRAKNADYLQRLEMVAATNGRRNLYDELVGVLEAPEVEIPEVGRWIRATTQDGEVHEFEVTHNDHNRNPLHGGYYGKYVSLVEKIPRGSTHHIHINHNGSLGKCAETHSAIKSWEYIDRPWKVGDLVPANTIVGKEWLGRADRHYKGHNFYRIAFKSGDSSSQHRIIEWIED